MTDHSDDYQNGKEGTEKSHMAAAEAVSGSEGPGDTKSAGIVSGLEVGPCAEVARWEDSWR